jgi:hypothetical protein
MGRRVVEQKPEERVAWRNVDGKENAGLRDRGLAGRFRATDSTRARPAARGAATMAP